jgi:cell division protein FtsW (lipid II flippase)
MINIKTFFSYTHLFGPATEPMAYVLYFFAIFALSLLASVILYSLAKNKPVRYQKDYFKRIADALFYIPILMILYLFIRRAELEILSQRIVFLILLILWLIWLGFLLYYRLAVIPKLNKEYSKKKREENYIRHGKSKK